MGVLESGEVWRQPLLENSWVVGGVPGAGKSVALNVLLARLAGRADVQLVLVDCKEGLEFGPWALRAAAMAGSPEEALPIIQGLEEHMRSRMRWMASVPTKRMADYGHSVEHPLYVLVIDEVAELWSGGVDRATAQTLTSAVSKLVRLGRAAGYVVVIATQKPTADAIPSAVSVNAPSKLAFRCTTPQQVTAIFGDPIPKGQPTPLDFTERERGYAVVSSTAGVYERGRTPYIGDAAIAEIVTRTRHLRRSLAAEDLTVQQPDDEDTEPVTPATSGQPPSESYEQPLPEPLTVADLHQAGEVGARTANRLGAYTLVELTRWTRAELLDLPGIGVGSVTELEAALHARGMALRPDSEDSA
jgi:S-DNA-T family DNA segregation ATPase FtsK/SpoIIIE